MMCNASHNNVIDPKAYVRPAKPTHVSEQGVDYYPDGIGHHGRGIFFDFHNTASDKAFYFSEEAATRELEYSKVMSGIISPMSSTIIHNNTYLYNSDVVSPSETGFINNVGFAPMTLHDFKIAMLRMSNVEHCRYDPKSAIAQLQEEAKRQNLWTVRTSQSLCCSVTPTQSGSLVRLSYKKFFFERETGDVLRALNDFAAEILCEGLVVPEPSSVDVPLIVEREDIELKSYNMDDILCGSTSADCDEEPMDLVTTHVDVLGLTSFQAREVINDVVSF